MPHDVLYNVSASLKDISKALNAINTNLCSIARSLEEIKNQKMPKVAAVDRLPLEEEWTIDPAKQSDVIWFAKEHHIDEEKE